jgi:5'-3' exonuclease
MQNNSTYLIDASIYIFKSYYSMSEEFTSATGEPINAVYGFTKFLTKLMQQTNAKYIACAFDESSQTSYRNEIYPQYKAHREPAPESLKRQFKLCQQVAQVMGIATFVDGYYEADDLIGTLAFHYKNKGFLNHIITADKDLAQLIQKDDFWWDFGKSNPLDYQSVYEKFGVYPKQIADFLALTGDAVDNIKGIPGIGAKTAIFLINHFNTLDEVLKRHKEISYLSLRGAKSCQKKIAQFSDEALLAKRLTEIKTDIPIKDFDIERKPLDKSRINNLFEYLRFGPLLRRNILELKNQ